MNRATTRLGDASIQYLEAGSGPPVVFFHGAGGPEANARFFPEMAARYRMLAPARPGFDGSTADVNSLPEVAELMADFIRQIAGGPVALIGESAGGAPACWLAILHPDLVSRLILVAPAAFARHSEQPSGPAPSPEEMDRRLFGDNPGWASPPTPDETTLRRRNAAENMRRWTSPDGHKELLARLHEIAAPTLILWGTEDTVIPQEQGQIYQREIPNSYLMYIYGAAHALPVAATDKFIELACDFIERGPEFLVNRGLSA